MSSFSKSLQLDFNNQVNHIITQNEGAAVGAYWRICFNEKISVIYLQNSGIGNIINPLSLAAKTFDVPLLFLIGWKENQDSKRTTTQISREDNVRSRLLG